MSNGSRTLKEDMARYMDNKAFVAVKVGKAQAVKLAVRRRIALERADACLRFLEKPENFVRLRHRLAMKEDEHGQVYD